MHTYVVEQLEKHTSGSFKLTAKSCDLSSLAEAVCAMVEHGMFLIGWRLSNQSIKILEE